MEVDRSEVDIGVAVDAELEAEKQKPRQPRRRFIGRRAAADRPENKGDSSGAIEESGAVQSGYQKGQPPP